MPNPTIAEASILHSGEVLWVRPLKADGTVAQGAISAIADGAAITKGGVTTPLTDPIFSNGLDGWHYPLLPARILRVVDDSDAGWASTGTWAEHTPFAGVGGYFNGWDAKNSQYRTAASSTATCTWTFTGLVPGRYRLSDKVAPLIDPAHTAQARYTVRDGTGASLAIFPRDLATPLFPRFDDYASGLELNRLGQFVLPPGQDTVAVTLSNAAGSGSLVADALVLESDWEPYARPGDEVTAYFPGGTATVGGLPTDEATLAVGFRDDADFCTPIKAPGERTILVGENVDGVRETWFSVLLADRSLACDVWAGDVTLDEHFEMTANAGTARRTLLYYPVGDSNLSSRGVYLMGPGVVRCEFTASGAPFDASARDATGLAPFDGQYQFGPKVWTDLGSGRWRLEQPVSLPAWQPISARTRDFSPLWTQGLQFVAATPGVVYTDFRWFDPRTPVGYAGTAHPDDVARLKGKVRVIRSMNWLGTNFAKARDVGDFTSPLDRATPVSGMANPPTDNAEFIIWQGNVVSIRPADLDPGTDADDVYKHLQVNGYAAAVVVTVDDASGYPDGNTFAWRGTAPTTYPSTISGVANLGVIFGAFRIGTTDDLLVCCLNDPAYLTDPTPQRATIDATHAITGTTIKVFKNSLLPPETFFAYCADVEAEPWVNVPHLATDALVDWMADRAIEGTPDGRQVHVEYSNEHWNGGYNQHNYFPMAQTYANWQHAQDPATYPYSFPTPSAWYAHRSGEIFGRFRARFAAAGRDPSLVVRHVGSLTANAGYTFDLAVQLAAESIDFDALTLDAYQDVRPTGTDLFGPDLAASWSRLSPDGRLDLLAATAFHGSRKGISDQHFVILEQHGIAGIRPSAYEGGWAYIDPEYSPPTVFKMATSPRLYRMTAAYESYLQDLGYIVDNKYVLGFYSQLGNNVAWSDLYTASSLAGTGSPSENVNPFDYSSLLSQALGGRADFGAGVDFDAPRVVVRTPGCRRNRGNPRRRRLLIESFVLPPREN